MGWGWVVCVGVCGCGCVCVWYLCHSLIQARIVMDSSLITIHIYWSPSPVTTVLKMPAHLFPHPHGCLGHPPTKSHVAQDDILTAPFASSLAPSLSISHDAAGGAYKTNFTTVPLKYLLTSPSPTKYGPNSQDSNLSLLYWTSHSPNRLNSSLSNKWKPQPP